jgi:hypothetical protein
MSVIHTRGDEGHVEMSQNLEEKDRKAISCGQMYGQRDLLEREVKPASNRPCRLHQVHRVPIAAQHWDVAFGEEIT